MRHATCYLTHDSLQLQGRPVHAADVRGVPAEHQGRLEGEPRHLHERAQEPRRHRHDHPRIRPQTGDQIIK